MKNYIDFLKTLPKETKKNSLFIFLTYFFALFSYPLVRSATGAYFYDSYTANEYSLATFIAIVFLVIVISISNGLQKKFGIHKLYLGLSIFTVLALFIAHYFHGQGIKPFAFILFSIKEGYIVLLIHLCLAFANNAYTLEQVKRLFGPLGAAGSIGGIIGGQLTKFLAKSHGTDFVFYMSLFFIVLTGVVFYLTKSAQVQKYEEKEKKMSPLEAVKDVKSFVFLICAIVALSQWVIFVADLQFNMIFEKMITTKNERTSFLGNLYSYINLLSLFIQFVIIPYALIKISNKKIFFIIPIAYLLLALAVISLGASSILVAGGAFLCMKASDYSIFAYSKEVLYHGLSRMQKFGAKYITDMFSYRLSKALIAFVMSVFVVKKIEYLNVLQVIFIFLWIICVYLLFKKQQKE